MLKKLLILCVVVVVVAVGAMLFMMKGPDLSKYEVLKDPRIIVLDAKKVMEVQFEGKSKDVLKPAFELLFKYYFKTKGVPKGPKMSPPLGRYEVAGSLPEDDEERAKMIAANVWKGMLAIPVPESINQLPDLKNETGFEIQLTKWNYGEVAEILHIGPYDKEIPTIKKLEIFIKEQGYVISGMHEEEYLRGPGMPFSKPENYYTIIRYPIKKSEELVK